MGWYSDFKRDVEMCRERDPGPGTGPIGAFLRNQGLWASLQYRTAHAVYTSDLPPAIKRPVVLALGVWQKAVEVTTDITLPKSAEIGGGLFLPHSGRVVVDSAAHLGEGCTLCQGSTIGKRTQHGVFGVPTIGNHVYLAPNAVVVGPITVGDHASIGPNAVVFEDVPAGALVRPALSEIVERPLPK